VPPQYDGAGMTMLEAGVAAEELGAALYPGPWLSTAVAATRALTRTGPSDDAASLLTGIADGSTVATLCLSAGPRPFVSRCGNGWVLNGDVASVPDCAVADVAAPDERHLAAVRTKAFAAGLATVGDTAIQVLGGIDYTWGHDAHLYLRRLLSWSAFLGGSDEYLTEVGARLAQSVVAGRGPDR
jgi:alkylation response protein AidB-like acyl-CoA dehydrogenase